MCAVLAHAGTVAVDNLAELERWIALAREGARLPDLWLHLRPALEVVLDLMAELRSEEGGRPR
jgi:hypothetical protein